MDDREDTEDDDELDAEDAPEDRAELIAYWRARPETWAALHEISRICLLRAMGVSSLGTE